MLRQLTRLKRRQRRGGIEFVTVARTGTPYGRSGQLHYDGKKRLDHNNRCLCAQVLNVHAHGASLKSTLTPLCILRGSPRGTKRTTTGDTSSVSSVPIPKQATTCYSGHGSFLTALTKLANLR